MKMKPSNRFRRDLARKFGFTSPSATSHNKQSSGRRPTFEMLEARQMLAGHPTDMMLAGNSVLENSDNGTFIGTVTTSDPNAGETFDYVLPNDAVGRFAINTQSGQITVANGALIDFESAPNIPITVRVIDSTGNTYDEAFTIQVTDVVNEGPVTGFDPVNDTGLEAGTRIDWVGLVDAAVAAGGMIINVSNGATLRAAMDGTSGSGKAEEGDIVVLASGSYGGGNINLFSSGTTAKPIIIVPAEMLDGTGRAAGRNSQGEAIKPGDADPPLRGVRFTSNMFIRGSNIIFGGFSYNGLVLAASRSAITLTGTSSNVRITDIEIMNIKNEVGATDGIIELRGTDSFTFDMNYFRNNTGIGTAGIRFYEGSTSAPYQSFNTVIEYNTFEAQYFPLKIGAAWQGRQFFTNTRIHYNKIIAGEFSGGSIRYSGGMSAKTSAVHAFRNYLSDAGSLKLRGGNNSSIIGNYIENSKGEGIYIAGGNQVVTNNIIVNSDRSPTSSINAGIVLKYGYPTEAESLGFGRRWALNNSLIANNTIIGAKINGILAQYIAEPDNQNPNNKEFAAPFDNVIVNNTVVSDNESATVFRGAYRFGISDTGDTDPNTGVFYPSYQFGDFTRAKTNNVTDPNQAGFDAANLKKGNNVVANNQAYRTDGVGVVTAGISSAGFLIGDPLFDPTNLFNGYSFNPTSASMLVDAGQQVTPSLEDYYGFPGNMGAAPDIGAIEFFVSNVNVAPAASDDTYSVVVDTVLSVSSPGVLFNDNDPNGDSLTAVLVTGAGNGNVTLNSNGSFTYTPDAGFVGSDSFTYEANDGTLDSNTATVNITVNPVSSTVYRDAVLALNPVGYWRLGETSGTVAVDETGNNNGTYAGGATLGKVGAIGNDTDTAVGLDGSNDYVNIDGYQGITGTGARTVSAWIKTTASTDVPIVAWGLNQAGERWSFRIDEDNGALRVESQGDRIIGTTPLTDGQWYNVAVTWADDGSPDISDAKLYVNGVLETISSDSANGVLINTAAGTDVRIGRAVLDYYAASEIDEVAIFGTALTGAQITDLYNQGIATNNADFDGDGDTDGSDFLAWQRGFGIQAPNANLADGDANGDKKVDAADLDIWRSNYGQNAGLNTLNAGAALQLASVAEPAETEPAILKGASVSAVAPELTEAATAMLEPVDNQGGVSAAVHAVNSTMVPRADKNDPINWQDRIQNATGTTTTVSTRPAFLAAAATAQPGDVILVADGTYTWGSLNIPSDGTEQNPIIYTAQTPGGVTFQNASTLFKVTGNWNIIGGFNINNIANRVFLVSNSDNRLTGNTITASGITNFAEGAVEIQGGGDRTRFDNNTVLESKGYAIRVQVTGNLNAEGEPSVPQDVRIDNNIFERVTRTPRESNPADIKAVGVLQVGQADFSPLSRGLEVRTVFEYNTIKTFYGRTQQIISNKSSYNIYRYNNFIDSVGGIGLRWGNYNQVYGNYWGDGESPRSQNQTVSIFIKGQKNVVANNVFDLPRADGAISESTWGTPRLNGSTAPPTGYNLVANNTILASRSGRSAIKLGWNGAIAPEHERNITGSVYVNNVIVRDNPGRLFSYRPAGCDGCVITNNIYYPTGGGVVGESFSVGANINGNPKLDSEGRPTANSLLVIDQGNPNVLNVSQFGTEFSDSVSVNVDYLSPNRLVGAAPDIGAIEFVVAGNVAPAAVDDTYGVLVSTVLSVSVPGVLSNDSDLNGHSLTAVLVAGAGNGNVVLNGNGSFTYTPNAGFVGSDSFTYEANDGTLNSNTATVNITVNGASLPFYRDAVLALNPVGYWRLGETSGTVAVDESGNNLNGTYAGGATLGQVGAINNDNNTAAGLDGADDYVNIDGYQGVTGTGARTISAWIKADSAVESLPIVAWGVDATGEKWTFRLDHPTGVLRVENEGGRILGTTFLADGQWHNVVVTWANDGTPDISDAKLYVDGVQETIGVNNPNAVNTGVGSDVRIGRAVLDHYAESDIDEVAIFGVALTGAQIAALYNQGTADYNADFDNDGDTDGGDFLAWQRGFGNANRADGDADGDKDVDETDLSVWLNTFGQNSGQSALSAGAALQLTSVEKEEFNQQGFLADRDADGVDLLSVLTHEMGHLLGLDHNGVSDSVSDSASDMADAYFDSLEKYAESASFFTMQKGRLPCMQ